MRWLRTKRKQPTPRSPYVNILDVLRVINRMQADGIISRYAIGGAVGATFYLEPVATLDVDVFISLEAVAGRLIIDPRPVFTYLAERGCTMEGEYVLIAGTPVQFLPAGGPLLEEGLNFAAFHEIDGVAARVFSAEHLAAMALQTGRAKDKARLLQFVEEGALNFDRFMVLLGRHGLMDQWRKFEKQFSS